MCHILDKRQKVFCSMCCLQGCHGTVLVKLIVEACEALPAESKYQKKKKKEGKNQPSAQNFSFCSVFGSVEDLTEHLNSPYCFPL